jgi:adenylate kinase
MKIAITGVPTVGKTTVAELLAKKTGYKLLKINHLAEELNAYAGYDKERESKILDMKKLRKEIDKLKGNLIFDGHVSHEFFVDIVIILRCNPEILEKRLKKKYPYNPFKVRDNVDVELLDVITTEALTFNKNVYEIDTSNKKPEEIVNAILGILKGKTENYKLGKIDWLDKTR